jgi:hypothetical protein
MQRYEKGDPVLILPKFAHLYPSASAVVIDVKLDQFRPMFNGYTLQFSDGSSANLFQFQIIDDPPTHRTYVATTTSDSAGNPRHIVLQTPDRDVDLQLQNEKTGISLTGKVLEKSRRDVVEPLDVSLVKEGSPVYQVTADNNGVFKFASVPRGTTVLLIVISNELSRILIELSV